LAEKKALLTDAEAGKATNDSLIRKIALLEEELDAAEKNLKETVEKYARSPCRLRRDSSVWQTSTGRHQGGAF
jgi:cell division protein FtsB